MLIGRLSTNDSLAGNLSASGSLGGRLSNPSGGADIPSEVRNAILTLFEAGAYAETGLTDEIAIIQSWAAEVTSLTLSPRTLSLNGDTPQTITATVVPSGSTVFWSSSDTSVATVVGGVVTGVSNGSCTITASAGTKSATCSVTVSGFATLESISAVYTQSGTVYDTDSLDSLKADLVVTATYDDTSTAVITDYVLSGTLAVGTSTITVTYQGKFTTFTVTVSTHTLFEVLNTSVDKSALCVDSGIALLDTDRDFTILFDGTQESALPTGYSQRLFACISPDTNWKGVFAGGGNNNNTYNIQWYSGSALNIGVNRTSTNKRMRISYRHTVGSGQAVVACKVNDENINTLTISSAFISNGSRSLYIGGASTTSTDNWVGTINRCTVYDYVLSDTEVNNFFA